MTPSEAQLAEIEARAMDVFNRREHPTRQMANDVLALLAALRDARAENERERATIAHYQGVLIATCAEKAEVQRREAELRARIVALCDEWERMWGDFVTIAAIRAALSPAEEQRP